MQYSVSYYSVWHDANYKKWKNNRLKIDKTAGKGSAVEFVCEHLQIPITDSVAAGDAENDISMLQIGDISYAVENALPHVKAVAKRQTVHYEQSAIAAIVADLEREL